MISFSTRKSSKKNNLLIKVQRAAYIIKAEECKKTRVILSISLAGLYHKGTGYKIRDQGY